MNNQAYALLAARTAQKRHCTAFRRPSKQLLDARVRKVGNNANLGVSRLQRHDKQRQPERRPKYSD
jgi:hypothetical protein